MPKKQISHVISDMPVITTCRSGPCCKFSKNSGARCASFRYAGYLNFGVCLWVQTVPKKCRNFCSRACWFQICRIFEFQSKQGPDCAEKMSEFRSRECHFRCRLLQHIGPDYAVNFLKISKQDVPVSDRH